MAYEIRVLSKDGLLVSEALREKINKSRFCVEGTQRAVAWSVISMCRGKITKIALSGIRLRQKKDYCGNHAGPCLVQGGRHAHTRFLEGLDWVSFNDMVNDVLDVLNVDGDIRSGGWGFHGTVVRKDGRRRVVYFDGELPGVFDSDGDANCFEDNRGMKRHVESDYTCGTPGYIGWLPGAGFPAIRESAYA